MSEERQGPSPRSPEAADPSADATAAEPADSLPADARPADEVDDVSGGSDRGERATHPERPCLNCGDPTPGEYCPTCGQRKVNTRASVRTLLQEVLEDQLVLDQRLPRTLRALFFRPGRLTVEHLEGRIVRYIQPFRLYLVSSLIFFVLLSFFSSRLVRRVATNDEAPAPAVVDSSAAGPTAADSTTPEPAVSAAAAAADSAAADSAAASPADASSQGGEDGRRTLAMTFNWEEGNDPKVNTGIAVVDSALIHQIRRLGEMEPREALETVMSTFFNYAPTMMFFLLPLFAAVLKLLYIRRKRFYAEHFVFLLHVHSFVFFLAAVMLVVAQFDWGWVELGLNLWILVYIFLAMKRVYHQGWIKTFAKYWILGWSYFWILVLCTPLAFIATILLV